MFRRPPSSPLFPYTPLSRSQLLGLDQLAGDRPRRLAVHVALELDDDLLGRERRARHVRRAHGLAAPALDAGVEVEPPLPRELLELRDAEVLGRLEGRDRRDLAPPAELREEDVERRREH